MEDFFIGSRKGSKGLDAKIAKVSKLWRIFFKGSRKESKGLDAKIAKVSKLRRIFIISPKEAKV